MFVEEGFRVRFANGEVIDFYADSAEEKQGWMKVLYDTVGKESKGSKGWTDVVLTRERSLNEKRKGTHTTKSAPSSPRKGSGDKSYNHLSFGGPPPPPANEKPRHQHTGSQIAVKDRMGPAAGQSRPKSMMF